MGIIPKTIGIIWYSIVLSLSVAHAIQAQEPMPSGPCPDRKGGQPPLLKCAGETRPSVETISGDVLRLEGDTYLVQSLNGKEVRLHVDPRTQVMGVINRGDFIEAKMGEVDGQQRVQSIREIKK
jgi:hypothetical protein